MLSVFLSTCLMGGGLVNPTLRDYCSRMNEVYQNKILVVLSYHLLFIPQ